MSMNNALNIFASAAFGLLSVLPLHAVKPDFAKGADVGWITEMESTGCKFYNRDGVEKECMTLLRDDCGVNSIRLRVWVNPDKPWNTIPDVVKKAKRAHDLGMRLMIDFHFSDTWADPGKQYIPAAWADLSLEDLQKAVADHVKETLTALKDEGITPEWVQIGNETTNGMMWPVGTLDHPAELTALNNAGYEAAKAVFPETICIVHLDNGYDSAIYDRMFDILDANGGKYDMIGMSLYPYWAAQNGGDGNWETVADKCIANIEHVKAKYGKPVMICEIGMPYDEAEDCRDLIAKMMNADVEGIFYWEPEASPGYNGGYTLGCFDQGRPTVALDAFKQ